jgi:hypothetical protein
MFTPEGKSTLMTVSLIIIAVCTVIASFKGWGWL